MLESARLKPELLNFVISATCWVYLFQKGSVVDLLQAWVHLNEGNRWRPVHSIFLRNSILTAFLLQTSSHQNTSSSRYIRPGFISTYPHSEMTTVLCDAQLSKNVLEPCLSHVTDEASRTLAWTNNLIIVELIAYLNVEWQSSERAQISVEFSLYFCDTTLFCRLEMDSVNIDALNSNYWCA